MNKQDVLELLDKYARTDDEVKRSQILKTKAQLNKTMDEDDRFYLGTYSEEEFVDEMISIICKCNDGEERLKSIERFSLNQSLGCMLRGPSLFSPSLF